MDDISPRPSVAPSGNICEIPGDTRFVWKVNNFFQPSDVIKARYESPKFYFSGASWNIKIGYKGIKNTSEEEPYLEVGLARLSLGPPVSVDYSLCLKESGGKEYATSSYYTTFVNNNTAYGNDKFIKGSVLIERKMELVPSNILTIICTLKNAEEIDIGDSLFRRHQDICDTLHHIYKNGEKTDLKLKFKSDPEISAHQMILEARSPVFAAMFNHDTRERQTGEIHIKDVDRNIMDNLLTYLYSGDIPTPTTENVLPLYVVADKYDINDIKVVCSEFICRNLSVDWVIDVIEFSELYQIEEVSSRIREYFEENSDEILESEKWENFATENPVLAIKLLKSLVKSNKKPRNK